MKDNNVLLSVLPLLSFVIGIAVAIIQLYVTSRQAKLEEKIKTYVDKGIDELREDVHGRIDDLLRRTEERKVNKEMFEIQLKLQKEQILNEVRQWKQ